MERLIKAGRLFYGIAMAAIGIHQLFYSRFCLMLFPPWPAQIPGTAIFAWIGSLVLIGASVAIILEKNTRTVSLFLGSALLVLFCFSYVPYEIFIDPYSKHLGTWVNPLKELAFSGGAFAVAGSYPQGLKKTQSFVRSLEIFIPFDRIFFSITMISFGIGHFLYAQYVQKLVPDWISGHYFWTYFAGAALIASGVAIILKIWLKPAAILLGIMVFLWFISLHIPRAIAMPLLDNGNEVTSAFSALAFSGTAFVIAGSHYKKVQHSLNESIA